MRTWGEAKRDWIKFRGKKMKARQFIDMLAKSLPVVADETTGALIDHSSRLKEAYTTAGLKGLQAYEDAIITVEINHRAMQVYEELPLRAKRALCTYFGRDYDTQPMVPLSKLQGISRSKLAKIRKVGDGTLKEIDNFMRRLTLGYGKED